MDDSPGGKCEPVIIVFECMNLSIGQRVNVSGLSYVSNKVLGCWDPRLVDCFEFGKAILSFIFSGGDMRS